MSIILAVTPGAIFWACVVVLVLIVVRIAYLYRRDSALIGVPDVHGDYPAVPSELIEEAQAAARRDIDEGGRR